jgi:hypothetical protein
MAKKVVVVIQRMTFEVYETTIPDECLSPTSEVVWQAKEGRQNWKRRADWDRSLARDPKDTVKAIWMMTKSGKPEEEPVFEDRWWVRTGPDRYINKPAKIRRRREKKPK